MAVISTTVGVETQWRVYGEVRVEGDWTEARRVGFAWLASDCVVVFQWRQNGFYVTHRAAVRMS